MPVDSDDLLVLGRALEIPLSSVIVQDTEEASTLAGGGS